MSGVAKAELVAPSGRPRRRHTLAMLGGSALVVLAAVGLAFVLKPGDSSPAMADPHQSGQQVAASIVDDYCHGNYGSVTMGMDDHGELGFTTINCTGPSGQKVSFGVFASNKGVVRAASIISSHSHCQDSAQIQDVAIAVRGPRWIAVAGDAADLESLTQVGGTQLRCG